MALITGVGVGVALLEEVCQWGWTLKFQKSMPSSFSPHCVQLLLQHLECCYPLAFPCCDDNGLSSETVSKPPVKYFPFIRINFIMVSPHSSRTVTKTIKWNGCMIGWFWILVEPRVSSMPGKCLISKMKPSKGLWVQKPAALAVVSV